MKAYFIIESSDARKNKFMQIADLFQEGEGVIDARQLATITLKKGKRITDNWIERTKQNLNQAFKKIGREILIIKYLGKSK